MRAQAPVRSRPVRLALALAMAAACWPAPADAVDAIPAEQMGQRIPDDTITALVGDVDGDGVREVVRIGPLNEDRLHLGVEAVTVGADGTPVRHGIAPLRRVADRDQRLDAGGAVPVWIGEPARLLVWRVGGSERVLAVASATLDAFRACCVTLHQVSLDGEGRTTLHALAVLPEGTSEIRAVDLDGDGTDELVLAGPAVGAQAGRTAITVLRWVDEGFRSSHGTLDADLGAATFQYGNALVPLGDSDGLAGDEVGVMFVGEGAVLDRITLDREGGVVVERAELPFAGPLLPIASPDGGRLLIGSVDGVSSLLEWPAQAGEITLVQPSLRRGFPMAAIGTGSGVRVLLLLNDQLDVLGPALRSVQPMTDARAASAFLGTSLLPYVGPFPGGLNGSPAFVFGGWLLAGLPDGVDVDQEIALQEIATLAATTPIGTFGADGAFTALAEGQLDPAREGGQLVSPAGLAPGTTISLVETSVVLTGEQDDGLLSPPLEGAMVTARLPAGPSLRTRDTFRATISGPPGSRVLVYQSRSGEPDDEIVLPTAGWAYVELRGGGPHTARIVVISPSGHGYSATWAVQVVDRPPPLSVSVPAFSLSLSVPVRGRTQPGITVSVDGRPADVAADGSFELSVAAGLLPRDVEVRATDPIGNQAARVVSVVTILDYRQLPWIPIVVVITLLAGVVLYFRVPRPSAALSRATGDDATLEEID